MRVYHTGNLVTDANLTHLEDIAHPLRSVTPEQHVERLVRSNRITRMLPTVMRECFQLPSQSIGSAANRWDGNLLHSKDHELSRAIDAGLVAIHALLAADGITLEELADRPRSRGEVFLGLLKRVEQSRNLRDLSAMTAMAGGGRLESAVRKLGDALRQTKQQGSLSVEQIILRAIEEVDAYSSDLYGYPAQV